MFVVLQKYFSFSASKHQSDLKLLEVFKPLYYVLSFFGLFPYSVDFLYGNKYLDVAFKSATLTLASTFLVPTVICVFFALHLLELNVADGDREFEDGEMAETNYIIELTLQLLVCLTTYFCAFINRNLYIQILNEMASCWTNLPKSIDHKILAPMQVKVYFVVFVSVCTVPILDCPVKYSTLDISLWKKVLESLTFDFPEVIEFMMIAFYLVMIMMIVGLLENIEEHVKILYCSKSSRELIGELGPLPASLRRLRGVYARALAAKRHVNAAFQAPLLLVLAQSFHTVISEAHVLYHGLRFQTDTGFNFVLECCVWITLQMIKIYTLGHSGAILSEQATNIGRTLHNIPTDIDEYVPLYLEVQHFTTSMKFHDADISVFGYFSLNSSLIFNVIASAAMYLVILVQFDLTE